MTEDGERGTVSGLRQGIVVVSTTYVYFLLFAQFGFLDLLQSTLVDPSLVRSSMTAMGLSGLAMSLATAWLLGRTSADLLVRVALLGCAVVAFVAPWCTGLVPSVLVSAGVGCFTGLLTVSVAASLRSMLPVSRLGLGAGLGTGLAYLVCNIPFLFAGSVTLRCWFPATLCIAAFVWVSATTAAPPHPSADTAAAADKHAARNGYVDYTRLGFATVVASFLALIWLDSAAFAVIQETIGLKGATWGSDAQQLTQGGSHLAGALVAGLLLDRGRFRGLLLAAFGLFVLAFSTLAHWQETARIAGPLYAFGISLYSTALVVFPSLAAEREGLVPIRWRAALLYGIAGWLGSALGVGMAQELHRIPASFVVAAGLVLALGWAFADRRTSYAVRRVYGMPLLFFVAALLLQVAHGADRAPQSAVEPTAKTEHSAVSEGRMVYIAEGCINCHSQYVRADSADVAAWGPPGGFSREDRPPMPGNRRQGPDLARVGNRRSAVWQEIHLKDPRALNPASRMPAYAHLFEDVRGADLVAYLSWLGRDTAEERYAATQRATIQRPRHSASVQRGKPLFDANCAACHGPTGRGDGPLAGTLKGTLKAATKDTAMDLQKPEFVLVSWGEGAEPLDDALARVVRFGVANTSMSGHETLSDQQVSDIVAYLRFLRSRDAR